MFLSWYKVQKMGITSDNLSMKIEIEITPEEEKLIKRLAKNCGLSISRFILAAINYFYEKELKH
jgi:uncharacterized protein (DUF1778 family)